MTRRRLVAVATDNRDSQGALGHRRGCVNPWRVHAGNGFVVIQSLHDRVLGFLRFRIERAPPRRGPKPAIGAYIVCGELRMTIQAGVTDDLWEWLMGQGWRELRYAPDRRHYLVVPAPCVTKLIDAPEEQRPIALSVAVSHASLRPIIGNPNAMPSYVVRH